MVKIRLRRMGGKKNPFYRIVVADSRSPRDGRCIEEIGTYDPLPRPVEVSVKKERAEYWLGQGAQPTDKVRGLLKNAGIEGVPAKKISKTPPKETAKKAEDKPAEAVSEETANG